jgi:alpha-beta hydrolase superfamily lysophospholipase
MTRDGETVDRFGIKLVFHPSPHHRNKPALLILLPGFDINADEFGTHGLVAALHDGEDAVDLVIAEPNLDFYLDGTITRRLVAAIGEQTRRPYRGVWLGGISLGCFGALLAASESPQAIDGMVLLAPFLGIPGLIAEVERAGGLATWQPGVIATNDDERRVLAWLKTHLREGRRRPLLHVGYGRSDRFAGAALLLAAGLPPHQIHAVEGRHDWATWAELWRRMLGTRPFSA